ncbi:MAG: stage II sporulation protein M [Planctomycetota bacterium JB042]
MAPPTIRSIAFRRGREKGWKELEQLVTRVEKRGPRALSSRELTRLPLLYRACVSSLSVARTISLDRNLLAYLESLASRAYGCVYGARAGVRGAVRRFLASGFPRAVRGIAPEVLASAGTLALGAAVAFFMVRADPELFYAFVDADLAGGRDPSAPTDALREGLYAERGVADGLVVFASYLFTHNARIGMLSFGLGFAAGVPVLGLLFLNGLMLGAFAALYHSRGLAVDLWGWILPHGVPELLAIVLCGAAGLRVGRALLFPGRHSRLENLGRAGRAGARVVAGAVGLLLVAGLIEGFFRQLVTDVAARYAFAITNAAVLTIYLLRCGREGGDERASG